MRQVLGALSALILSIALTHYGIAFASEQRHGGPTDSHSKQSIKKTLLPLVLGTMSPSGDSKAEKRNSVDSSSIQGGVINSTSPLLQATEVPEPSQKAMHDQYNLIPFDVSEDNYADTKKKLRYLWARATFLDDPSLRPNHGTNEGGLQPEPALFPLNTGYNPAYPYGSSRQYCISPLPEPLAKESRCNDDQLTGFCRVKFMQNGRVSTLVGMLANTPDNVSGCLLPSRKTDYFLESLGDENLLPRDILVTDKKYYQINVTYDSVTYRFRKRIKHPAPFASTVLLSGSLRHETLCKSDSSPGTQWYSDGGHRSGYGCSGLTAEANPAGSMSHFIPVRRKARPATRSPVIWQTVTSEEGLKGVTNLEAYTYFCSPIEPYEAFILGSLAGQGPDKYCRYIGTSGKSGYVATNQDGTIGSYLRPVIDGYIRWQAFEGDLPEKAIIAGYSFSNSGKKIIKVPQYFCRFLNNGYKTYGKYFGKEKVCKASFATPCGDSHALVDSKDFEILVKE